MKRRTWLQGAALPALAAQALAQAGAVAPARRSGTLRDIAHIVVLTQENRSFDHYFGAWPGVRGFGDRFPVPVAGGRTVWQQPHPGQPGHWIQPFALDLERQPALLRLRGTPHRWPDAQAAWDHGRMGQWTLHKQAHAMAHYRPQDLPFQVALAEAFTLCDAYHCSFQGGTTPNRMFLFTGTNDGLARGHGPAIDNDYETADTDHGDGGYAWVTYAERLQAAGVAWQVYQDAADNFGDNALAAFKPFRDAHFQRPGHRPELRQRGMATHSLAQLREDVQAGRLPAVSWVVGTAEGSEHPDPSSPAQGAAYVAQVLEALSSQPEVWARTVLLVNYDENDGFFDHVPPPAPPSRRPDGRLAGHSSVPLDGEYHQHLPPYRRQAEQLPYLGRPYGLGPRVPMFVVSPFSRGGWVNSQVFDHTSVIRLMEACFGVKEPNISAWRRAVCGDLTTCLDLRPRHGPAPAAASLPPTGDRATQARRHKATTLPLPPAQPEALVQPPGPRPARALPYQLSADIRPSAAGTLALALRNRGTAGAVLAVWDMLALEALPLRFTLAAGEAHTARLAAHAAGRYDLFLLGPNGFHRRLAGQVSAGQAQPGVAARHDAAKGSLVLTLSNPGPQPVRFLLEPLAYGPLYAARQFDVPAGARQVLSIGLAASQHWYDWGIRVDASTPWFWRLAGHVETGADSFTDPAMHT